ncbi:uncharacterized protein LOC106776735 [Vigna radiata var. radiata]|uniref:Uncharacterized protein LOC106776735 n=1 Tax=Vigna radiata var. radiata TaxID=3916 RepID=A0A1S3VNC4_VIGRR|nr:uncharacterized protein LOC106776735 [Vigna radiata var. radiata]
MECIGVASRGIVHEVLTRYNYQEWKTLMKSYLRGENLWDVVENGYASTPIDAQRDAKALHIIQLSCAPNIFNEIKDFQTAHIAWNHLAKVCRSEFKIQPHIRHGVVSNNVSEHKALYKFVENDDWEGTSSYLRDQPNAIFWTPPSGRTVLHVATIEGHTNIVEGLVYLGKEELVKMQDEDGNTALALAAGYTGNVNIAKRFVNVKDGQELLAIKNKEDKIPLLLAANSGRKRMTRYLFFRTPSRVIDNLSSHNRVLLLEQCIQAHIFDVALTLLNSYEELSNIESLPVLQELARMPSAYLQASRRQTMVESLKNGTLVELILTIMHMFGKFVESKIMNICGQKSENRENVFGHKNEFLQILRYYKKIVSTLNSSQLRDALVYDAMLEAAKHGNVEFINDMREANHDLLWAMDNHGRDIFSYAVIHRKHNVFRLMHTLCGNKDIINYSTDMFDNNLLHLAAPLGPLSDLNLRPGAALQMQREIQWFKAVEEVVHVKCREAKNGEGKTPEEIFIETHKELMKDGEKWAKETAGTFAIVGVLVITVMFAAVFTVPGGLHQETGVPLSIKEKRFTVFIVADVISLLASIITVLIYIDLQTSRYAPTDFLKRLPIKIMSGLGFLSLSLISMMIAFCAALGIVLTKSWLYKHLFIGVVILTGIPFILLVPSQLRLLLQIFQFITSNPITGHQKSTFIGRIFRKLLLPIKACRH